MSNNDVKSAINPVLPLPDMHLPELIANLMGNLPGLAYRCLYDQDWSMIFLSQGCLALTGYSEKELANKRIRTFDDLIIEEDKDYVRMAVDEAVAEHRQFQMEYRITHRDGSIRWVWEQGSAVYSDQGKVLYLDGFIADISKRKHIEQELKDVAGHLVELNATKDKFFSLVAHDLQNPVYAIISLSEFLEINHASFTTTELTGFINQINVSAKNIYSLLENLLDWARSQTGKIRVQREYFSLPKLINSVIEYFRPGTTEKDIVIMFNCQEDIMVESDSRLLISILRNLLSNAIKYSYPGSKVKIQVLQSDMELEISVIDKGTGISRRFLDKIFRIDNELRALGTNHEEGSGLGLILVKSFADILGARVQATSKINQGSTFSIILKRDFQVG
jgi:PAS domain S-box-containing protein